MENAPDTVTRKVIVHRDREPNTMLHAVGFNVHLQAKKIEDLLKNMPRGEGVEAVVHFFILPTYRPPMNFRELEIEYESRGLLPADPYTLASVNEVNNKFVDKYPSITLWRDGCGNCFEMRCFVTECHGGLYGSSGGGERFIRVVQRDPDNLNDVTHNPHKLWFAGLRAK